MIEVPAYFKIDQDAGGTAVDEISAEEYADKYAVMVMERALEVRKAFSFPEGNVVDKIMEEFIRDRILVENVEKVVLSRKLVASLLTCAAYEVSCTHPDHRLWIFDGIVPIEISESIEEFEIVRKDK